MASHVEEKVHKQVVCSRYNTFRNYLLCVKQYIKFVQHNGTNEKSNILASKMRSARVSFITLINRTFCEITREYNKWAYAIDFIKAAELREDYEVLVMASCVTDMVEQWLLQKPIQFSGRYLNTAQQSKLCNLKNDVLDRVDIMLFETRQQLEGRQMSMAAMENLCDGLIQVLRPVTDIFDEYVRFGKMVVCVKNKTLMPKDFAESYVRLHDRIETAKFSCHRFNLQSLGYWLLKQDIAGDVRQKIEQVLSRQEAVLNKEKTSVGASFLQTNSTVVEVLKSAIEN